MGRRLPILAAAIIASAVISACAEHTITNASNFSDAAVAYEDRLPPLLDVTLEAAVVENSRQLIRTHEALTSAERQEELEKAEARFAAQFKSMQLIKRQAALLRSTFISLNALASSDAASKIGEATKLTLAELDNLSQQAVALELLQDSQFSSQKDAIQGAIESAADFFVAQFKAAAIRDFLEQYGGTISTALTVQEQLLSVIAEQLTFYRTVELERGRTNDVFLPYVADRTPNLKTWSAKRLSYYAAQIDLDDIKAAEDAARNVRLAFVALAEDRVTLENIDLILRDVARMQRLFGSLKELGESATQ